ncbi:MAG TPA: hypothetical protein VLC92_11995 [Rhodocyclaceae bacterium]|nr:hypothetical protein [Rhodocyclaceae bacterium]
MMLKLVQSLGRRLGSPARTTALPIGRAGTPCSQRASIALVMLFCTLTVTTPLRAMDVAILDAPVDDIDKRNDYTNILLTEILKRTEPKYGPFRVAYAPSYMYRDRLLTELKRGVAVNVTAKATRPDWEDSGLLTLRIPVDKGISEYRIALIRAGDQDKFSRINDVEELKRLTLGVGHAWSTRQVFQALNFKYEAAADWESLYKALVGGRFDYFPRALSEVFVEYDDRKASYPDIAIENSLLLYFPLPKYFFVSPQAPHLAARIEDGFRMMIKDGSFNKLFLKYHQPLIDRADFCSRRILRLNNPLLSNKTPLDKTEYWYDPDQKRSGRNTKASCLTPGSQTSTRKR